MRSSYHLISVVTGSWTIVRRTQQVGRVSVPAERVQLRRSALKTPPAVDEGPSIP